MSFQYHSDSPTKNRKGFSVTYENGYTVSVQFGYGNYGDNYNGNVKNPKTAECAVLMDGEFCRVDDSWEDNVKGHMTSSDVTKLMFQVMNL
jgi:hypothetical protein